MLFNVGISAPEEANKFLRSLWAEFRKEFGKCAWNYAPYRTGKSNTIFFGIMDLGISEGTLKVNIVYVKKGTIKNIIFEFVERTPDLERLKELTQEFKTIIHTAKSNVNKNVKFSFRRGIGTLSRPLGYYKSDAFTAWQNSENGFNIAINTVGYDEIDAKTESSRKFLYCLDLIAVETNAFFWIEELVNQEIHEVDQDELFVEDQEWIDDHPVIAGKLRLSKAGKQLLDLIAKDQLNKDQEKFLMACNHFHTARKYDAQVYDLLKYQSLKEVETGVYQITFEQSDERLSMAAKMGATHMEISSVLYISALEVASSIGIEKYKNCTQCGQKVYSIKRRVVDMTEKYLNVHLAQEFKGYYEKRSNYLHEGELLSNYSYIGTTIPQLEPSDPTGCKVRSAIPLLNLREYTSFCLRKVLQSLVASM